MTGHENADGDVVVKWGAREWVLSVLVTLVGTGAIGTSAYTANAVSARDAAQNERIVALEAKSAEWDKAADSIKAIAPLLERIDERTENLQNSVQQIRDRLP